MFSCRNRTWTLPSCTTGPWTRVLQATVSAGILFAAFLLTRLSLLHKLCPASADSYTRGLFLGLCFVRVGLVLCAALVYLLPWLFERAKTIPASATETTHCNRIDYAIVGLLLFFSLLVRMPLITDSFWWDELSTIVRLCRRSFLVVLGFSAQGNNHVLNTVLMKCMAHVLGESEFAYRLPALTFGIVLAPTLYLGLRLQRGRAMAGLAGCLTIWHFSLIAHAVEARGYSAALLFSVISCILYRSVLATARPRDGLMYSVMTVLAAFSIPVAVIVPFAHGVITLAVVIASRGCKSHTRAYMKSLLWCIVSGSVIAATMGLHYGQLLEYTVAGAARSHVLFGLRFITNLLQYLSGSMNTWLSVVTVGLSGVGLISLLRGDIHSLVSYGAPVLMAIVWLLLPGARYSERMFFFLIPTFLIGLAHWVSVAGKGKSPLLIGLALCVLLCLSSVDYRLYPAAIVVGNPDLKGEVGRTCGFSVALCGPQSDVNSYYFPRAIDMSPNGGCLDAKMVAEFNTEVIIRGVYPGRKGTAVLDVEGYRKIRHLYSWRSERPEYEVYRQRASEKDVAAE